MFCLLRRNILYERTTIFFNSRVYVGLSVPRRECSFSILPSKTKHYRSDGSLFLSGKDIIYMIFFCPQRRKTQPHVFWLSKFEQLVYMLFLRHQRIIIGQALVDPKDSPAANPCSKAEGALNQKILWSRPCSWRRPARSQIRSKDVSDYPCIHSLCALKESGPALLSISSPK